jgi:Zn-dependent peptidase ImmA (M78 family)/transcriptional regulator with XRE-family HTH domain
MDQIAKRLRQARDEAGLTQQQVADWLGVRRPGVAEIEAGRRAVKTEELARLASLYGRSIAWLSGADALAEDRLSGALFRASGAEDPVLRREAHLLGRRCRLLAEAEGRLGLGRPPIMPQYPDDAALGDYGRAVEHGRAVAYQERERLSLGVHAPLSDVWGIVEGAGLRVFALQLGQQHAVDGIFAMLDENRACVGVNVDKWIFRQIFTVVHEYAHALLDRSVGSDICRTGHAWTADRRDLYANRELRANQFAAVFLVPREALLRYLANAGKLRETRHVPPVASDLTAVDIVRAQDHFSVSADMVLWRMVNEKVISANERHRLLEHLGGRGVTALARSLGYDWRRKAQPVTRAQEIALLAYGKGHLSLGELAEIHGMDKSDMLSKLGEWGIVQEFADSDALLGATAAS